MLRPFIVLSIILCCSIMRNVVGFQFTTFQARLAEVSGLAHSQIRKEAFTKQVRVSRALQLNKDTNQLDNDIQKRIDQIVKTQKVVLFMKGNKLFPQCGFSNTATMILQALNTPFETVDVLEDNQIRNGIKIYSSWPTIPQLYIGGEFVGGSDIMMELYENGELAKMIALANAP